MIQCQSRQRHNKTFLAVNPGLATVSAGSSGRFLFGVVASEMKSVFRSHLYNAKKLSIRLVFTRPYIKTDADNILCR